ncbi:MAG TPA: peptidoglycan recognition family protein [Candidatus Saccharimonadales bacterium]|nr:peptidoglycan recognition family protein [Candidatus Saccharimonadales bacterium]
MTGAPWTFDEKHWSAVVKRPDWYLELVPYFRQTQEDLSGSSDSAREFRNVVRGFLEKRLLSGEVALAKEGPNLDAQRLPIDTIVIHHTSHRGRYSLDFMEATQLLNIYAPYYFNASATYDMNPRLKNDVKGQAIWSGHFKNGRQTFLCYHWLLRMDGTFERLLEDKQLGWHAGNWDINRRSVAICLDNDYQKMDPSDDILRKLADHINANYGKIEKRNIIGHCEARLGTICPGGNFIGGWKETLLGYLHES